MGRVVSVKAHCEEVQRQVLPTGSKNCAEGKEGKGDEGRGRGGQARRVSMQCVDEGKVTKNARQCCSWWAGDASRHRCSCPAPGWGCRAWETS